MTRGPTGHNSAAVIRCLEDLLALDGKWRRVAILDFLQDYAGRYRVYLSADDGDPAAAALIAMLPTLIGLLRDPAHATGASPGTPSPPPRRWLATYAD